MSLENDVGQKGVLQYDDVAGTIVTAKDKFLIGGNIVNNIIVVQTPVLIATSATTGYLFIADANYVIVGAKEIHAVAGGSAAALTVEHLTGTTAPGSGTAQLNAAFDLTATANTPQSAVLIASPNTLAAGDRLGYKLSGTLTGLVNCVATVYLKRV